MPENVRTPATATLTVFRLAALFTFLAVAMGAVVCATGSGAACPTWLGCRPDQVVPGWELNPLIEFTHRAVAVAAGPLVLAAALMSTRLRGPNRWVRVLPWVALVGAAAAAAFGRRVVLDGLPTWLGAVDLFCALTAMTAMAASAVMLGADSHVSSDPDRRAGTSMRLAATSVVVLIAMHVTGILAAGPLSYTRCMGWPLWQLIDTDLHPWLQVLRLVLGALGAVLVVATAVVAGRSKRLRGWGIAVGTLFAVEMMLGIVIRTWELNPGVAAAYSITAVALLWCLGLLMAVAWGTRAVTTDTPPRQDAVNLPV